MQYTEEDYAQMYNDLPEGLKDLVLSGRLAILVSAIGSRHGLNADQVADLEPAIEDVCLGLITTDELVDNIIKNVNVDQRVANRIAAEAELEILKPFEAELVISRKQKEDLDAKIQSKGKVNLNKMPTLKNVQPNAVEPKDVSAHSQVQEKKVADWYSKGEDVKEKNVSTGAENTIFDWDKTLAKKEVVQPTTQNETQQPVQAASLENKLDQLTESINKLVNTRFGDSTKKEEGVSKEMQELLKRLEKAEKENEENKKLIRNLQAQKEVSADISATQSIFGSKIQIDKERKVDINHAEPKKEEVKPTGNVQVTSVSKAIPIEKTEKVVSSTVSQDTLDSIVEIRNKTSPNNIASQTSTKKTLSLDELISGGDSKIKQAIDKKPDTGTLVFPGINDEKKIDIKNINQKDAMRQTLLEDLEFLKKPEIKSDTASVQNKATENTDTNSQSTKTDTKGEDAVDKMIEDTKPQSTTTDLFKDELLPKTKEERMRALQDKIKSLNKGISSGGKTNITASGLDPYRI